MTAVELEKLRLQKREARRLLKTLVYLPRKPTETLSDIDSMSHLSKLEGDIHEIGHVVALYDGWHEARKKNFRYHRMSVLDVLESGPRARTRQEIFRQEEAADRNEIETISFTWLTLRFLGHNVEIDTLIESADGTLENPRTDLEYSVKRAVRSTRIQKWSREFANLLQELAR